MADPAYLAVARLRKPHGLKGEALCWVLTDTPERVLVRGRRLVPVDASGRAIGDALEIERSRAYHRQWLLKFVGVNDRTTIEGWKEQLLGVAIEELEPPLEGEMYEHELEGAVVRVGARVIGRALGLVDLPAGRLLVVEVEGREVLVPFRRPIVSRLSRAERAIELDPPAGLLEL